MDHRSPIHLHSPGARLTSLLKEERPYQLFLVQSSRAQGVCSERPDSPRIPSGSPGRATRCARLRAAYAWDPEALQGVRRSGTGFAGEEPRERRGEWRGCAHPGLTGSRPRERARDGAGHPRTLALPDWSGRFVTVLSRPRVKGGFQGQGTPRRRGQRGEGGVPSGPGHRDPAATAREDKVAPSGAGI